VQFLAPDGAPCESGKICTGGLCAPGCFIDGKLLLENTLNPSNRCQLCIPSVSTTEWSNQVDGIDCDNGDVCTADDICQAGECVGIPVICTAQDQCQDDGVCDPMAGGCVNPPKMDGTVCDDNDACTQMDACNAGTCSGGTPIECLPTDECHDVGLCDPTMGICSDPIKADGTACETGFCKDGVCEPGSSSSSGTGGEGGGGGSAGAGGSNELEPLVGRGGGCVCTVSSNETPRSGAFAAFGLAILSLMRRVKRSKK
jgi:MYXO-CTERM domain-containing protein